MLVPTYCCILQVIYEVWGQLLGYMLHWGLYGILLTQVCESPSSDSAGKSLISSQDIYHLSFPRDPKIAKAFVYVTFMIETVQTIIITKTAWHVFAVGYGDYSVYDAVEMGWFNIPLIGGTGEFVLYIQQKGWSERFCSRIHCADILRLPYTSLIEVLYHASCDYLCKSSVSAILHSGF